MAENKNIVVITGSPRKDGNSFAMADAFVKAAEEKGHDIVRFDTAFLTIKGCVACGKCYSKGTACVFQDDFNAIASAIEAADAVVFATPLYWYSFPWQIKGAMDKFYAFVVGSRGMGKKCALLGCCEEDEDSAFDAMRFIYERSISLLQWTSVGEVLITSVAGPGDIVNTNGIKQAEALAEKFRP